MNRKKWTHFINELSYFIPCLGFPHEKREDKEFDDKEEMAARKNRENGPFQVKIGPFHVKSDFLPLRHYEATKY